MGRGYLELLTHEPPGIPYASVVVAGLWCCGIMQQGYQEPGCAQEFCFWLMANVLKRGPQGQHVHGKFVGAVSQGGAPCLVPGLLLTHCVNALVEPVALICHALCGGRLQQLSYFLCTHVCQGLAAAGQRRVPVLYAGVIWLPCFRREVEQRYFLVQTVARKPTARRRSKDNVQNYIVEVWVCSVSMALPILGAGINFYVSPYAFPVQLYFCMGEIRARAAVPASAFQNPDGAMMQRDRFCWMLVACPEPLNTQFLRGWSGTGCSCTTGVNVSQ